MTPDIRDLGSCSMNYGNPSGHASFAACMYPTIFMLIFHDRDYMARIIKGRKSSGDGSIVGSSMVEDYKWFSFVNNKIAYWICLAITVTMAVMIGVSRFMLGAHSIDQVLYGWHYGLWFAFFLFRYARPFIHRHMRLLLETDNTDIAIHDQAAIRGQSLKNIIIALVAWIILIVIAALIYYFTSHDFDYPQIWIEALIRCNGGSE